MKPPTRIATRLGGHYRSAPRSSSCTPLMTSSLPSRHAPTSTTLPAALLVPRTIHTTSSTPATVSSLHGAGPPPEPPRPATDARLERRNLLKEELLAKAKAARSPAPKSALSASQRSQEKKDALLRKRFWKDVHVGEVEGMLEVHLDKRPLRRPDARGVVRIPRSKPLLAGAVALEWDLLTSAQQATRQHLIPLTSLVCRALDIADDDDAVTGNGSGKEGESIRQTVAETLIRYLDTDSLLCWAPPPPPEEGGEGVRSLRELQRQAAEEVVGFLGSRVWPGVRIDPVLDGESLLPRPQTPETRQIVQGWIAGLSPWELAALERGVLAGKSLLGAARLLVEWSEGFVGVGVGDGAISGAKKAAQGGGESRFGVEEAARMASIEVDWQTGRWGEVEDTHDVEKEDLRRQLGSVVLLVSGTGER